MGKYFVLTYDIDQNNDRNGIDDFLKNNTHKPLTKSAFHFFIEMTITEFKEKMESIFYTNDLISVSYIHNTDRYIISDVFKGKKTKTK